VVVLFVVILFAVFGLINVFTLVLPRSFLNQRQQSKNAERQSFAMSQGWQFRPFAPELLTQFSCRPFTERGDRRVVFGVLSGMLDGLPVTVFDFQRRTKRTSYGMIVYQDSNEVNTVWVVKLPAALPPLHISARGIKWLVGNSVQPRTPDPEFNKRFLIDGGDENLAMELFTPQVTSLMRQIRLDGWTIQGDQLIHSMVNRITRTTPQEIMDTARALTALVRAFPPHLWNGAAVPSAPQQVMPQPVPQAMPSQPMPQQPMPQQLAPQQLAPQYLPQPYPQQQYPPQQYPQQPYPQQVPGYYPPSQPPQVQPGYGPPNGWQPQGYPPVPPAGHPQAPRGY
jgi:hypothetical protein